MSRRYELWQGDDLYRRSRVCTPRAPRGVAARARQRMTRYSMRAAKFRTLLATVVSCVVFGAASPLPAQINSGEKTNVYRVGGEVRTQGRVNGDFIGAGGSVSIDDAVTEDATVAGGAVRIRGPVGDDLRVAGGQITLEGKVGGEAMIAGGNVTLTRDASVAGRTWIAAGNVALNGKIAKDLQIRAGKVIIDGEVDGDARIIAGEIELLPGARLNGSLSYLSQEEVRINPQAQVRGSVTREVAKRGSRGESQPPRFGRRFGLAWFVGLVVAGALYLLIFPTFSRNVQQRLAAAPWPSLGLGAALISAVPLLAIALVVTIIGIPLALGLLAAYAITLLAGYLIIADFIGERALRAVRRNGEASTAWRIAGLVLALVALALVRFIPVIGGLLILIALFFGVGALTLQVARPKVAAPQ